MRSDPARWRAVNEAAASLDDRNSVPRVMAN